MKKIYIETIRRASRFGLIDEDGNKTPCGIFWSAAQNETFRKLLNGGNNLCFAAWDSNSGKKTALWAKWTDGKGGDKLCKLGTFIQNAPIKEFVETATEEAKSNRRCGTCAHYECVNKAGQISRQGMGICTLINRDRYCLFKCEDWRMRG